MLFLLTIALHCLQVQVDVRVNTMLKLGSWGKHDTMEVKLDSNDYIWHNKHNGIKYGATPQTFIE